VADARAPSPVLKWLLITVGVFSVALGVIGIFLPLLPTTPFLLLAAACFARSSDRLYRWLTAHRVFGSYIRNYREQRAIPLRAKVVTLLTLWASIGYVVIFVAESLLLRIALFLIASAVTWHVLRISTMPTNSAK
jgi:hypothetical protein